MNGEAVYRALNEAWRKLDLIQRRAQPGDEVWNLAAGATSDIKTGLSELGMLDRGNRELEGR